MTIEEVALEKYPEKFEQYTTGIPNDMFGMCDSNYYARQAFIEGYNLNKEALDNGITELRRLGYLGAIAVLNRNMSKPKNKKREPIKRDPSKPTKTEIDYELGLHDCGQNPYCSSYRSCGNDVKPFPSDDKIKQIIEIGTARMLKEGDSKTFIKSYFKEKYPHYKP